MDDELKMFLEALDKAAGGKLVWHGELPKDISLNFLKTGRNFYKWMNTQIEVKPKYEVEK